MSKYLKTWGGNGLRPNTAFLTEHAGDAVVLALSRLEAMPLPILKHRLQKLLKSMGLTQSCVSDIANGGFGLVMLSAKGITTAILVRFNPAIIDSRLLEAAVSYGSGYNCDETWLITNVQVSESVRHSARAYRLRICDYSWLKSRLSELLEFSRPLFLAIVEPPTEHELTFAQGTMAICAPHPESASTDATVNQAESLSAGVPDAATEVRAEPNADAEEAYDDEDADVEDDDTQDEDDYEEDLDVLSDDVGPDDEAGFRNAKSGWGESSRGVCADDAPVRYKPRVVAQERCLEAEPIEVIPQQVDSIDRVTVSSKDVESLKLQAEAALLPSNDVCLSSPNLRGYSTIDEAKRSEWKSAPIRTSTGKCSKCLAPRLLTQITAAGFVMQRCKCKKRATLRPECFSGLDVWVACPSCGKQMEKAWDRTIYAFFCNACKWKIKLADIVPNDADCNAP